LALINHAQTGGRLAKKTGEREAKDGWLGAVTHRAEANRGGRPRRRRIG
jgi:hypothetical protein